MEVMQNIRNKVQALMDSIDTSDMNTNRFVFEYLSRYWKGFRTATKLLTWPSLETILRERRYIVSTDPERYTRTNADDQILYIQEYTKECTPSNS